MSEIHEPGRRVSDAELRQLRAEFRQHVADQQLNREEQQQLMIDNARAINALTLSVGKLTTTVALNIEATAPLIEIHHEVITAARLGTRVGDFFIWLGKFGVSGAALVVAGQWVVEHLPKGH